MIDSEAGGTVRLGITSDGVPVDEIEVTLKPGSNVVDVSLPEVTAGGHAIEVALLGAADAVPQNDRSGLTLAVAPKALVAVVTPELEWGGYFARALACRALRARSLPTGRRAVRSARGWPRIFGGGADERARHCAHQHAAGSARALCPGRWAGPADPRWREQFGPWRLLPDAARGDVAASRRGCPRTCRSRPSASCSIARAA